MSESPAEQKAQQDGAHSFVVALSAIIFTNGRVLGRATRLVFAQEELAQFEALGEVPAAPGGPDVSTGGTAAADERRSKLYSDGKLLQWVYGAIKALRRQRRGVWEQRGLEGRGGF